MRSTAGETEFWKSLGEPIQFDEVCVKYGIEGEQKRSLELLIEESRQIYDFEFLPKNESDRGISGSGRDSIWTRADWVAAYNMISDLIRKVEYLLSFVDERARKAPRIADLINTYIADHLPDLLHRRHQKQQYNKEGLPVAARRFKLKKKQHISEHILWLCDALEQVNGFSGLFFSPTVEHWRNAIWPLFLFARDDLRMHVSDSFRQGHNPPDHLRKEWDAKGDGKKKYYPIPGFPIQKFLFDCMLLVDNGRARTTTLRSLLSEWAISPDKLVQEEPPPKRIQRKLRPYSKPPVR